MTRYPIVRVLVASLFAVAGCFGDTTVFVPIEGDAADSTGGDSSDLGDVLDEDADPGDADTDDVDTGADADASDANDTGGADGGDADTDAPTDADTDEPATEDCSNTVDDDGDLAIDCADPDCAGHPACATADGCGDGDLDLGESCEDGNTDDGDGCSADCTLEAGFVNRCGDGIIVAVAGERCDDGDGNSDTAPDACRANCQPARCGDGVVDSGELCDAGGASGTCTGICTVVATCGDGIVQAPEQCDDGDSDPADGCHLCELTAESECGDGVFAPAFETCDAGQGCAASDFCNASCRCETPVLCGNGRVDSGEQCDGSSAPCGGGVCTPACRCVAPVCGNNVVEGSEQCDGTDSLACTVSEACNASCRCERVAAPVLSPIATPLLGGSLTVDAWAAPARCAYPNQHGYEIRLQGRAAAQVTAFTAQASGVDVSARVFEIAALPAGDFDFAARVCSASLPEGRSIRMTVRDASGRESNAVNWTFPALGTPSLTAFTAFTARDPNVHVFRLSGEASRGNVWRLRLDILDAAGGLLLADLDANIVRLDHSGGSYKGATALPGVAGFGIGGYDGSVVSFGGAESAARRATVTGTPTSGGACIPLLGATVPTCALPLVCRQTTDRFTGTCAAASGSAPALTSISAPTYIPGSPVCSAEVPDELRWTINGSASEALMAVGLRAAVFGPDEFDVEIEPVAAGSFSTPVAICTSGRPGTVTVRLVDEAGRRSGTREFTP